MGNPRAAFYEGNPELQTWFQVEVGFRGQDGSPGKYQEIYPEECSWDGLKIAIAKTVTGDSVFNVYQYAGRVNVTESPVKLKIVEGKNTEFFRDHQRELGLAKTHMGRWMLRVTTFGEDQTTPVREYEFDYGLAEEVTGGFSLGGAKEELGSFDFTLRFETFYDVQLAKGKYKGVRQHTYTGTGDQAGSFWPQSAQ